MPFIETLGEQLDTDTYLVGDDIRVRHFNSGLSQYELQRRLNGSGHTDFLPEQIRGDTVRIKRTSTDHFVLGPNHRLTSSEVTSDMTAQLATDMALYPWGENADKPESPYSLVVSDFRIADAEYSLLATSQFWTLVRRGEEGFERLEYSEIDSLLEIMSVSEQASDQSTMAEAV